MRGRELAVLGDFSLKCRKSLHYIAVRIENLAKNEYIHFYALFWVVFELLYILYFWWAMENKCRKMLTSGDICVKM